MATNGTRLWQWLEIDDGDNQVQIRLSDGDPNGTLTAPKGSLAMDFTNGELYLNTDGSTAWENTSGGGSAAEEGFIRAFIGKDAAGSETPDYNARITGSVSWIGNNDDLELAIAKLDEKLGPTFTAETRTKGQLTPATDTVLAMLAAIDDCIGADSEMTSVNYIAVANSLYANLSALDAQVKLNTDEAADIRTTTGTANGDTNMGAYTGDVLTDNQSAKQNIQELSDAIEDGGIVFTQDDVTGTLTTIDSVPLADADFVVWKLKGIGNTDTKQRWAGEVFAMHDGTDQIDDTIVPVLRLGTPKLDVDIDVDIDAGNLRLRVATDTAGGADFTAIRVSAF